MEMHRFLPCMAELASYDFWLLGLKSKNPKVQVNGKTTTMDGLMVTRTCVTQVLMIIK